MTASTTMPESTQDDGVLQDETPSPKPTRAERQADRIAAKGQNAHDAAVKVWLETELTYRYLWLEAEAVHAWLQAASEFAAGEVITAASAMVAANDTLENAATGFIAKLQVMLEGQYFLQQGYADYASYAQATIAAAFPGKPQGIIRNALVAAIKSQVPKLSQRKVAEVVGTDAATVNRVLNGSETGAGANGHGGARKSTPAATPVDQAVARLEKVDAKVLAEPGDLERVRTEAVRVLMDTTAALGEDWSKYVAKLATMAPRLHSSSEGNQSRMGTAA